MQRFADAAEDLNKKLQHEASSPPALTGLQPVCAFINKTGRSVGVR